MKAYLDLWRRCFDYKGVSTRREFWLPFGIHVAIAAVIALMIYIETIQTTIVALILAAYLIISGIPFISLTVRRLHDVGKSGWYFFLWFGLGIGTILLLSLIFRDSIYSAVSDLFRTQCVYGPPPVEFELDYAPTDETGFTLTDNIESDM